VKSETNPTNIPHFRTKMEIEKHLKEVKGGMKWTILRPTSFMDNLAPGFIGKVVATSLKQMGSVRISLISTRDIGRVACAAFERPEVWAGRAVTLAGDLLTFGKMSAVFNEETGREIPVTYEMVVDSLAWAIKDMGLSMSFFRDGGYDYELDRGLVEELGLRDFRTWLREDSKFDVLNK